MPHRLWSWLLNCFGVIQTLEFSEALKLDGIIGTIIVLWKKYFFPVMLKCLSFSILFTQLLFTNNNLYHVFIYAHCIANWFQKAPLHHHFPPVSARPPPPPEMFYPEHYHIELWGFTAAPGYIQDITSTFSVKRYYNMPGLPTVWFGSRLFCDKFRGLLSIQHYSMRKIT